MYIAEHQAVMGHPETSTVSEEVSKCHEDIMLRCLTGAHQSLPVSWLPEFHPQIKSSSLSPMLEHYRDVTCTDLKLRICLSRVSMYAYARQ